MAEKHPTVSVVAPCFNEEGVLHELYRRISQVLDGAGESWELVLVNGYPDDGMRLPIHQNRYTSEFHELQRIGRGVLRGGLLRPAIADAPHVAVDEGVDDELLVVVGAVGLDGVIARCGAEGVLAPLLQAALGVLEGGDVHVLRQGRLDQLVGFDVDLAQAIAARWGVQVELVSVGFDSLVDAVWSGKLDSALSVLPYQPHLTQDVAFSSPYFEAGLVLVTSPARPDIGGVDDLAGRRLAVEWGSEGDVQARTLRRRFPDLEIMSLDLPQAALQAVAEGRADAALVDNISALQYIAGDPRLHIVPPALVSDAYVIVMPLKAPILRAEVDKALAALKADGTLDALAEKWLGAGDGAFHAQ